MEQVKISILMILFGIFIYSEAESQLKIDNIYFEQKDVFDSTQSDWFFAAPLLNALHTNTRNYIVRDELLFESNQWVEEELLFETERNLRQSGLFTNVRIELDSVGEDRYDAYVITQDRWSTYPSALFGTGGGENTYGFRMEEFNLAGFGTYIAGEALHRSENGIGWQGAATLTQPRLFRSELMLTAGILAHEKRTTQSFAITKPYRTTYTNFAYGVNAENTFGSDYMYLFDQSSYTLLDFTEKKAQAWFSKAWDKKDRIFFTGLVEYHDVNRSNIYDPVSKKYSSTARAFDNTGKIIAAFSSIDQNFYSTTKLNSYFVEDMTVGGWGTAILGKFFPIGSKGESYYYVAGKGEMSHYDGINYIFGSVVGASAFETGRSVNTYLEFQGKAFHRFNSDLLIALNLRQQTVWNWFALRQLIIDNDYGMRGYPVNYLSGDNRIIGNLELRYFPDWELSVFKLSGVVFYDFGSVWEQQTPVYKSKLHNSMGLGLRFHFTKSPNENHVFRIDVGYNFDDMKIGGIVFTTSQQFSAFTNHLFKLPKIFGLDFDYE